MASQLMKSVSGIRGIVGETFTPELIMHVARAFAAYTKCGKIVIGRDGRCTGHPISSIVESTLSLYGCEVIDLGIVPTPTVQIMVEDLDAAGGIIISASHNPIEWNAFKLVKADGTFLNSREIENFFKIMDKNSILPKVWDEIGEVYTTDNAFSSHIKRVVNVINLAAIKRKRYKVALDSVNASGSYITTEMLKYMNCKIIPVYCEITGTFPRVAEPQPQNLSDLSTEVLRQKCDIGFAQDPDADRLALVDEKGVPLSEEYTLALVTEHLLSKAKGRVVTNLSTTKAIEDIAVKYGVECIRTAVGEINVVEEMKHGARIGGEGNGGIISPEIHLGRDSLAGIGYILDMMAERKKSLSELFADLPQYYMRKGKVNFNKSKLKNFYAKVKKSFKTETVSDIDGIRIDFITIEKFNNGWVHLRPSNTEPIFRIICEADTIEKCDAIYNYCARLVKAM